MGDNEYSRKGFPIRMLETPPLAQHTRTAFQPKYAFGFVLNYHHITKVLNIPYHDNGTFNWLVHRLEEEGVNMTEDGVELYQLPDIGLGLMGSFFVYFAKNIDTRDIERTQNRELIDKLLRVVKQKETDAVWLLCDRHANVDDDEVTVHQLDDIGLDLIGSFFVYFAENSDARGLEQAQNRDLIEKLLRVVKQKESDAVWLLCDRHA
ncbi:hypothetical protein MKEN_00521100 [Mycena kentingensis (nom. inval.)]|nr:hypothetical protein MKEN_00521100 [Mycena kentingensis (nom. inval.)]